MSLVRSMAMDFDQLRYFISIAQSRNFTNAAKMHHITQPAISRRIDSLEREMGCKLFVRNSHSVALTDAGQEFFEYAVGVMNMTEAAQQRMENIAQGRVGRIRISLVPTSAHAMRMAIREFHRDYPGIQLDVDYQSGKEQITSIRQKEHDFYFTFQTLADAQEELDGLVTDTDYFELVVPASYSHLVDMNDLSSLNKLPLLVETAGNAPFLVPKIEEICAARGFQVENTHSCNSFYAMIDFVNAGIGYTVIPHSMERSICTDHVVCFRLQGEDVNSTNVLAWDPGTMNETKVLFQKKCQKIFQ